MTSSQEVLIGIAQVLVSCLKDYNDVIKAMYGKFHFVWMQLKASCFVLIGCCSCVRYRHELLCLNIINK